MFILGSNTVNLYILTAYQQSILSILMIIGNVVFVSISVVIIQRHFFRKHLSGFLDHSKAERRIVDDIDHRERGGAAQEVDDTNGKGKIVSIIASDRESPGPSRWNETQKRRPHNMANLDSSQSATDRSTNPISRHHETGFGGFPAIWEISSIRRFFGNQFKRLDTQVHRQHHGYISFHPSLDHRVCMNYCSSILIKDLD